MAVLALLFAPAPQASANPQDSVPDFLGCLRGQKAGSLLILFDTTGSLETNDPDKRRADAAKALIAELSAFAKENNVQLDAAVTGFGWNYQPEGAWSMLPSTSGSAAVNARIDAVSSVTSGTFESDFWAALDGAQKALQAHAQQTVQPGQAGSSRCQALLWFTDGEFHLRQRTTTVQANTYGRVKEYAPDLQLTNAANITPATRKGLDAICADGGPADQLRAANVTIWSIGLSPANNKEKPDLSLLQRVAEGVDRNGKTCGALRNPPGKYFQVGDVEELVRQIWVLAHPGAQHLDRFVLDDALSGVSIAAHQSDGQGLRLVGPGSIGSVTIPSHDKGPGQAEFGSTGVTATWRWDAPDSLTVDITRGSRSWLGVWSIQTANGTPANPDDLQVSLRGNLLPAWPKANKLVAGETSQVQLGLVHTDGTALDPADVPGRLSVDAELVPKIGTTVPIGFGIGKTELARPRPVDLTSVRAGPATARLTLGYTTQVVDGLSTTLAPQVVLVPVEVEVPPNRGSASGSLAFGDVHGPADATASIQVHGPSCAWLPTVTAKPGSSGIVGPQEVGTVTVSAEHSSAETCLHVGANQTVDLPVHLATAYGGTGGLSGSVTLDLASADNPADASPVSIGFSAQLTQPVDVSVAVPAFLIAFLLGLGIPIGLLYLLKWYGARIPGHPLQAVLVPVTVVDGEVLAAGAPLRNETLPAPVAVDLLRKGTRSTSAAGVALRTKMGASPFGAGFVEAGLPPYVGASSAHDAPAGKTRAAKLPLAVHNTWALFHDPGGDPATGRLLVLRGFDLDANGSEALLADARAAIPRLLPTLHQVGATPGGPGTAASAPGTTAGGEPAAAAFGLGSPPTGWSPGPGAAGFGQGASPPGAAEQTMPLPAQPLPAQPLPPQPPQQSQQSQQNQPSEPQNQPGSPPDAEAPPDWSSQSFGTFGLGTPTPPDDPAGERKAP